MEPLALLSRVLWTPGKLEQNLKSLVWTCPGEWEGQRCDGVQGRLSLDRYVDDFT